MYGYNILVYWMSSPVVTALVCGYFMYYFYKVVHRPCLVVKDGEFKSKLVENLHVLKEHYWPTFWAFSRHFQTIGRVLFKSKPYLPYERDILTTPDKGQLSIDWLYNDINNKIYPDPKTRPTVIMLPGITGCSDASYSRHIMVEATSMGYRALVFNNRGMGKINLKTPRTFCACNGEDLDLVLNYVVDKYPESPLFIFAVSLGGVILTNYLSTLGKPKANIVAALLVSVPYDSMLTTKSLEQPINWLFYNRFILNRLKELVSKNWHVFQEHLSQLPYKLEDVMKSNSIREFDESFTSKTFGFSSNHEYYTESSLTLKPLEDIKVPMLFLNAKDDPFAPEESIPLNIITRNSNMAVILTDYGGHIGFVEGATIRGRSLVERLFHQYASCMLDAYKPTNDINTTN